MSVRLNYVDSHSDGQGHTEDYSPKSGANLNSLSDEAQTGWSRYRCQVEWRFI
jgi:hypothetical protein